MTNLPTLFEDSDLSGLTASPSGGQPGKHASGVLFVGAGFVVPWALASHTHTIAQVTGLQAALDGKQAAGSYAAAVHSHAISDVTGLQSALDGKVNDTGDTITGPLTVSQGTGFSTLQVINDGNNGAGTALCVGAPSYGFQVNGANYDAFAIARFATVVPLTIRGAASQTADLQRWQNSAGSTLAYVNSGGAFVSGSAALNYSGAGVKLGGTADIEFAPTNIDGTTDALIVRSGTGQIDVRAGLTRFRNFAGSADGPISAGAGTFNGNVLPATNATFSLGSSGTRWADLNLSGNILANGNSRLANGSASGAAYAFVNASGSGMYLISPTAGSQGIGIATGGVAALTIGDSGTSRRATFAGPILAQPFTFATVPSASASTGDTIRITDRSHRLATSDGTNWNWAGTTTPIS